jgi:hypothetical protein
MIEAIDEGEPPMSSKAMLHIHQQQQHESPNPLDMNEKGITNKGLAINIK